MENKGQKEVLLNSEGNGIEERVCAALTHSRVMLFSQDAELRYTWICNPLQGFEKQEFLGSKDEDIFSSRDAAHLKSIKRKVMKTGAVKSDEMRITLNGEQYTIDITVGPQADEEGDVTGVSGTMIERTGRGGVEEDLAVSRERYRAISELIFGFVYSFRVDLNFKTELEWLAGDFEVIAGLSEEEAYSRGGWTMRIHPDDHPVFRAKIRSLLAGNEDVSEYRLITPDGGVRWLRDYSRTVWDESRGKVSRIYGAAEDITGRRTAAEALGRSEERFRLLAENSPDMIYRMSLTDGRYEYVSPGAQLISGYTPEEFYKNPGIILKHIHPDFKEYILEQRRKLFNGEIPQSYEYAIIDKSGNTRWLLQRNNPIFGEDGVPVAIEGVIIDITEMKKAERDIRESEARFRLLAENSTDLITRHDPEGRCIYASPACRTMLGYEPEEMVGHSVYEFFHPDDLVYNTASHESMIHGADITTVTFRLHRKDGEYIWTETLSRAIRDRSTGDVVEVQTSSRDITERKKAEDALRESEEKFRRIVDTTNEGVWVLNADSQTTFVNARMAEMLGRRAYEILGRKFESFLFKEDIADHAQRLEHHHQGLEEQYERRFRHKDGRSVWAIVSATPMVDDEGRYRGAFAMCTDITDRKRAEDALRESEEKYRRIVDTSNEGIYLMDSGFFLTFINKRMADILGYRAEELIGLNAGLFVFEEDQADHTKRVEYRSRGLSEQYERRLRHKDGHAVWTIISSTPIMDDKGSFIGAFAMCTDITDRKQAEVALRESEEKYRRIVDTSYEGIWASDEKHETIFVNARMAEMIGYPMEEMMGRDIASFVFEEDRADHAKKVERRHRGIPEQYERRYRRKDGRVLWTITSATPIMDDEDRFLGAFVMCMDITDRKQAEVALRESEEKYRRIVDTSYEGIWVSDEKHETIFVNVRMAEMLGYRIEELIGVNFKTFMFEEDQADHAKRMKRRRNGLSDQYELRFHRKDGRTLWAIISATPIMDDEGRFRGAFAMCTDITDRKQAEVALRESEEKYRRIVDTANEGIIILNAENCITSVNTRMAEMLGYEPDEITGWSADLLLFEEDRGDHAKKLEHRIQGRAEQYERRLRRKNGQPLWAIISATPVMDGEGRFRGSFAMCTDITDRKQAEDELKLTDYSLERSTDPVWWVDSEALIFRTNESACRLLGYSREEITSLGVYDIDPLFSHEVWPKFWQDVKEKGNFVFETLHRDKSGRVFPVEVSANYFEYGGNEYNIVFFRDITDRKRAEEALRESEEKYRRIVDTAYEGVLLFDENYVITFSNARMAEMLGCTQEELVGLNTDELIFSEDKENLDKRIEHRRLGRAEQYEQRMRRRDGRAIWTMISATPVFDGEGRFRGSFGMFTDITDHKQAEDELRESEAFLNAIFEHSPFPMWVSDSRGTMIRMNQTLRNLFHVTNEELVGKYNVLEDNIVKQQGVMPLVKRVFEHGERVQFTLHYDSAQLQSLILQDTAQVVLAVTISPVVNARNQVIHAIIQHQDITERKQAEEALRESEEKYRRIVDTAYEGVWVLNRDFRTTFVNARMAEMLGYRAEEMMGEKFESFLFEEDLADNTKRREARLNGIEAQYERKFRRKDGQTVWIIVSATPIMDGEGRFIGSFAMCTDITKRKHAEESLRESEQKFRGLYENTVDAFAYADLDGPIREFNEGYRRMMGYEREELLQMTFMDVTPEKWHDREAEILRTQALTRGYTDVYQKECLKKDGTVFPAELSVTLVRDEKGRPKGYWGFIRDITERTRAEEALRESEEKYRRIVDTAYEGVWVMNEDFLTTFVNARMAEMLGYRAEEMMGEKFESFLFEEDLADHEQKIALRRQGLSAQYERKFRRKDGAILWTILSATPIMDSEGQFRGSFAMCTDITKGKQANEALRESEEHLRQKLDSILSPEIDVVDAKLSEILDIQAVQSIMDDLYALTHMALAILDLKGNILVANGWQDICTKFHRVNPEACRYCTESDLFLTRNVRKGKFLEYRCKNNLWDSVTPLFIGGKHVGNLFTGQYFYEDEEVDEAVFAAQAEKYGFDREEYLAALKRVPRVSRERVRNLMSFLAKFSALNARLSFSNLKLARLISEQKRIDEALRESEERYRHLSEVTYEGIIIHENGVILDYNRRLAEMLGYRSGESIPSRLSDLVAPECRKDIQPRMRSGDEKPFETRILLENGGVVEVEIIDRPVNWHGRYARVVSMRDITERRDLEANIARLRREYEVFMRHELKNLLIPITMDTDMLMQYSMDGLDEAQRNSLRRIRESTDRAARVIDSLKRLQDIEAGKYAIRKIRSSLKRIIHRVIAELRPLADRHGVTIQLVHEQVSTGMALDRDLMPGVFSNLILNAIQHVADLKNPAEKTVAVEFSKHRDSIVVMINNRGKPIPQERLKTFFDKFNSDPDSRFKGTGLGTTYARLVVRAHGGNIYVTSTADEGTTVTVVLPRG